MHMPFFFVLYVTKAVAARLKLVSSIFLGTRTRNRILLNDRVESFSYIVKIKEYLI